MATQLPIVWLMIEDKTKRFYADKRLGEYRAVGNPHERYQDWEIDEPMDDIIAQCKT